MEGMVELAERIGFGRNGEFNGDGEYVITLKDSNEYSKAYSKLDRSEEVFLEEREESPFLDDGVLMTYVADGYVIELKADFADDVYTVSIKED